MKKIILLALTALMMVGCCDTQKEETECDKTFKERWHGFHVEVVASGNQGFGQSFMAHKGNCRFCKERRQKELEELVIKLKEK